MTIQEAISQLDSRLTNVCTQLEKIAWLSTLDSRVKNLIIDTHEGAEAVHFDGYTESTDLNTVLLVPAPYDEMYLRWMEAQIHYINQEEARCNNANDAFEVLWVEFWRDYNRKHMPKGAKLTV